MECGLWGPALVLARAAGDAAYAETAAAMAAATAGPGSPLSSLLLMLAGGHDLVLSAKPSARSSPARAASGSSFNLKGLLHKSASKVNFDGNRAAGSNRSSETQRCQQSLQLLLCGHALVKRRICSSPAHVKNAERKMCHRWPRSAFAGSITLS